MAGSLDYTALRSAALLNGLDDDQLKRIWKAGTIQTVKAGDPVIKEGDVGDTMYVLLEGVRRGIADDHAQAGQEQRR